VALIALPAQSVKISGPLRPTAPIEASQLAEPPPWSRRADVMQDIEFSTAPKAGAVKPSAMLHSY
jgi:hypothetical protein